MTGDPLAKGLTAARFFPRVRYPSRPGYRAGVLKFFRHARFAGKAPDAREKIFFRRPAIQAGVEPCQAHMVRMMKRGWRQATLLTGEHKFSVTQMAAPEF